VIRGSAGDGDPAAPWPDALSPAIGGLPRPVRRAVLQGHVTRRHLAHAALVRNSGDLEDPRRRPSYSTSPPLRP
jgi:hypothetical protein